MTEQWVNDLDSTDTGTRRAAILALAQAAEPAALPALNRISRADPDLDLRVLALKAVRYIELNAQPPEPEPVPLPPPPKPKPDLSLKRAQDLGTFYLDAATNYHMEHDRPRALENLGKALQHDLALGRERYVQNLIEQLLGLDHDEAVALLSDPARLQAHITRLGGKRKLSRRLLDASSDTVTWKRVFVESGVLLALALGGAILILFATLTPLHAIADSYSYRFTARIAESIDSLRNQSAVLRLGLAVAGSTLYTLGALLLAWLIDAAAIYTQAGHGARIGFTRRIVRMHIGAVILGVGSFVLLTQLDDPALRAGMLSMNTIVTVVVYVALLSAITGSTYAFDEMTGCYTVGIALLTVSIAALVIGIGIAQVVR